MTAQVPAEAVVTVAPETVHTDGVSELNDTASPEVVLADRGTTWPTAAADGCPKMIACDVFWPGSGLCLAVAAGGRGRRRPAARGAAAKRSSPAWEAVTVQVPTAAGVTVAPETVHTDGVSELNDTASPEVAEADRGAVWPAAAVGGCSK